MQRTISTDAIYNDFFYYCLRLEGLKLEIVAVVVIVGDQSDLETALVFISSVIFYIFKIMTYGKSNFALFVYKVMTYQYTVY